MEGIIKSTTLPNRDGDRKIKEIKLDVPSKTIIHFLDTISVSTPPQSPSSFDECAALLLFADKFGCHELSTRVTKHLHHLSIASDNGQVLLTGPQLLMWTSDKDDWAMGRKALSMMNRYHVIGLLREDGYLRATFRSLRPAWSHLLVELILYASVERQPSFLEKAFYFFFTRDYTITQDWSDLAEKFVQPKWVVKWRGRE